MSGIFSFKALNNAIDVANEPIPKVSNKFVINPIIALFTILISSSNFFAFAAIE